MQAIVYREYGPPDVLRLEAIDKPAITDDAVLVRVHAASINPIDAYTLAGAPYLVRTQTGLRKPKRHTLGVDFAGTVEAVGSAVERFRAGDDVFGVGTGTLAEYVVVRDELVVHKPAGLSFTQAAAVPVAALTALQALRDKGRARAGQRILINGASGGVGTFAVQIAKALGAEVTAVCSTRNVDLVRSIGADHVVDYNREDFTDSGRRYDLLLDGAGNRTWSQCARVLEHNAIMVLIGGPKGNRWVGPLSRFIKVRLASMGGSRTAVAFMAKPNNADLLELRDLLQSGKVTPVIDRQYALSRAPEAFGYLEAGHARGKIVITV